MRKIALNKLIPLVLIGFVMTTLATQCKKEDSSAIIQGLDRTYNGAADSAVFATFYSDNVVSVADANPKLNDSLKFPGVLSILKDNCGTTNCHGGTISPKFETFVEVRKYVTPGRPESSMLWNCLTTNDFNKAMPPVTTNTELSTADKSIIYNWILNGAKERPDVNDFRPAAVSIISQGCTSGNCHNEYTALGGWARKGLIPNLTTADTTQWTYINPVTAAKTIYCQLTNTAIRNLIFQTYKDSVRKFYTDTVANASFRPYKTFSTPVSAISSRGPFNTYDDIIFDICYPKSLRSNTTVSYTDPVSKKAYYVKGNYLNSTSTLLMRVDSTLVMANPFTGVYATSNTAGMANSDGGLKPNEIALVKAWYFSDPNIPDVWKYGNANAGIFKYKVSGKIIKK
ncbi:MAG: hypothetical protein WCP61_05220 [Chitinophagia bacterium]|jgi:hypothetical protein